MTAAVPDQPLFLIPGATPPGVVDGGQAEQVGDITLICDVCGEEFEGPAGGRNSASFALGRHRRAKHRESTKSGGKSKRRTVTATAEDHEAHPITSSLRDIGAAMGESRGVPTADQLAEGMGRGLQIATIVAAKLLVETDPNIGPADEETKEMLTKYLSLDRRSARGVMGPIARVAAPTSINKKYGRKIVDNIDVLASFGELGTLAMHYRSYFRMRANPAAGADTTMPPQPMQPQPTPPPMQAQAAAPPPEGGVPPPPMVPEMYDTTNLPRFSPSMASPAPQSGTIVTPDTVALIKQRQQQQGAR